MAKSNKPISKKEQERRDLISYFNSITTNPVPYAVTASQIKQMMENDKELTYAGLKYALWYGITHEHMQINSIAIAPYIYNDAKKYYKWQTEMKKNVANWELDESEVVVVKRRDVEEDIFV